MGKQTSEQRIIAFSSRAIGIINLIFFTKCSESTILGKLWLWQKEKAVLTNSESLEFYKAIVQLTSHPRQSFELHRNGIHESYSLPTRRDGRDENKNRCHETIPGKFTYFIDWLFSLEFMNSIWRATLSFCCMGVSAFLCTERTEVDKVSILIRIYRNLMHKNTAFLWTTWLFPEIPQCWLCIYKLS